MARGFDSKFVEAQQEDATREAKIRPSLTTEQRDSLIRRQALELSRARVLADLARATAPPHKRMLEQAISALDEQIGKVVT